MFKNCMIFSVSRKEISDDSNRINGRMTEDLFKSNGLALLDSLGKYQNITEDSYIIELTDKNHDEIFFLVDQVTKKFNQDSYLIIVDGVTSLINSDGSGEILGYMREITQDTAKLSDSWTKYQNRYYKIFPEQRVSTRYPFDVKGGKS